MMVEPGRVDRPSGAACALFGVLLVVTASVVACGSEVPLASDPLVSASLGPPPLPSNVGPSGCQPPSPADPLGGDSTEIHGAAGAGASLWAKVVSPRPIPSGRDLAILWRIPGSSALQLVAVGPGGTRVHPTQVAPTTAPGWDRPGDALTSALLFPAAGCWRISATRGQVHGDVWLQVS